MTAVSTSAPDMVATRMARLLRRAADVKGAWVSTEAGVRTVSGAVWRPAVLVALGEVPYDGVVEEPPLLIVETDPALAERWYDAGARAVWSIEADAAVMMARGRRRRVARGKYLTIPGHPWLRLPAAELLRAPSVGNVVHLPR